MTTVVSILMSDIIPLKERGVWQGLINVIYAGGASAGAPLGGVLADLVGWRWAFLGQAPLCLLAFVAVVFALKLPATEQKDWRTCSAGGVPTHQGHHDKGEGGTAAPHEQGLGEPGKAKDGKKHQPGDTRAA